MSQRCYAFRNRVSISPGSADYAAVHSNTQRSQTGAASAGWKSGGNDSDKFVCAKYARYQEKKRFGWQPKRTRQRRVLPQIMGTRGGKFSARLGNGASKFAGGIDRAMPPNFASRLIRRSGCRHVNR